MGNLLTSDMSFLVTLIIEFLPLSIAMLFNFVIIIYLIIRFKNKNYTNKEINIPINLMLIFVIVCSFFSIYITSNYVDIAETDREKAILINFSTLMKFLNYHIIIIPLSSIVAYNLAVDFKVRKNLKNGNSSN
ncbi:hypothetical protein [Mammaliicoccus sciuri]|uniref:Uncharacterized protein n=1 Tax=Mammaliicoccus sciuri TaxID=1296 RepID=A0AAW5LR92_MAMSC|nr:hypothetical protein [Mammaliicoccus sciuri]MCQ9304949.1 hypothetical protein [Mammaliicoccus sciuri]